MARQKTVQTAGQAQLGEFAPKFAHLNDDILFGEVWSRSDLLSLRDRSMVTITALISQGIADRSLKYHLQSAKDNGITRTEIAEIITHIAFYAGWPKGWTAFNLAKGCRNNWHIHHATTGGGQMLIGIAGRGWYQEEGKAAQEILPGTVIHIPANVKHWHGASKDSWFAHLAFEIQGENTSNEWLEPVCNEEYNKIK